MKKIISALTVILLLCALLPRIAADPEPDLPGGFCGRNVTWSYDPDTGHLEIDGTGKMDVWDSERSVPWYPYREDILTAEIREGVTSIGFCAFFYNYNRLESVAIPASMKDISSYAFNVCRSLKNVFYGGTEEDWEKIIIRSANESLDAAVRHWSVTDPGTHILLVSDAAPTCASDGSAEYRCACGYVWTQTVHSLPHVWETGETVAPGCVTGGYTARRCAVCGTEGLADNRAPLGHDFQNGVCVRCGLAEDAGTVTYDGDSLEPFANRTREEIARRFYEAKYAGADYNPDNSASWYSEQPSLKAPYAPGVLAEDTLKVMAAETQYFRWLVGVRLMSKGISATAGMQLGALVRNWDFNHSVSSASKPADMPAELWDEGAAVPHNILMMYSKPRESIAGWMNEGYNLSGDRWTSTGHKELMMGAKYDGYQYGYSGSVTIGKYTNTGNTWGSGIFAAYPPPGDVPLNDFWAQGTAWTVELNTDVLTATDALCVTVTDAQTGGSYRCTRENGYLRDGFLGAQDIVFIQPRTGRYSYPDGSAYRVLITGLTDAASGKPAELFYTVRFFDLNDVKLPCVTGENRAGGEMSCGLTWDLDLETGVLEITGTGGMPYWSKGETPWRDLTGEIRSVVIGDGVTRIGPSAFENCAALTRIEIPAGVTEFGSNAFSGCDALTDVYYAGSARQWRDIRQTGCALPGNARIHKDVNDAGNHWYLAFKEMPTCTETGLDTWQCPCGYTYGVTVPRLPHDWEDAEREPPSCTEPGREAGVRCAGCGAYRSGGEVIPALGHEYENYVCIRCGAERDPCEDFSDIPVGSWYRNAAGFVIKAGLMGSTKTDALTFEPNTKVSRAMVASILYRMAEKPAVGYTGAFSDVKAGAWYAAAIEWCAQNKLASGKGGGRFDPMGSVTRQELAVFMKKMADYLGRDTSGRADLRVFPDCASVPAWSRTCLEWAVDAELISGKQVNGITLLAPAETASRAELASILTRFLK